jgi:hypothetical protein
LINDIDINITLRLASVAISLHDIYYHIDYFLSRHLAITVTPITMIASHSFITLSAELSLRHTPISDSRLSWLALADDYRARQPV